MTLSLSINPDPTVVVSDHAARRAQHRGVKQEGVIFTAVFGESIRAPGGSERRTMTRKVARGLAQAGLAPSWLSAIVGTVIITSDDLGIRTVLTVRPTEKKGKRRGGIHKPKYRDQVGCRLSDPRCKGI